MNIIKVLYQSYPHFYPVLEWTAAKQKQDKISLTSSFPSLVQVLHQFSNDLGQSGTVRHVSLGPLEVFCKRTETMVVSIVVLLNENDLEEDIQQISVDPILSSLLTLLTPIVVNNSSSCGDEAAWNSYIKSLNLEQGFHAKIEQTVSGG